MRLKHTHPFPLRYNQTSPSTRSEPFPCSVRRFPATIAPASRCCCETLPESRTVSRPRLRPSSGLDLTSGTHRGTTAPHFETLHPPWFASRLSWRPESDSLSCRDFAWWFSAVALSCRWVACCWTDTRHNATRTRKAGFAACAPPPRSCAVRRARRDLWAVRWRAKAMAMSDVAVADFVVSRHFAMNALAMQVRDCDWNGKFKSIRWLFARTSQGITFCTPLECINAAQPFNVQHR